MLLGGNTQMSDFIAQIRKQFPKQVGVTDDKTIFFIGVDPNTEACLGLELNDNKTVRLVMVSNSDWTEEPELLDSNIFEFDSFAMYAKKDEIGLFVDEMLISDFTLEAEVADEE
jgi:hypothetical protein